MKSVSLDIAEVFQEVALFLELPFHTIATLAESGFAIGYVLALGYAVDYL